MTLHVTTSGSPLSPQQYARWRQTPIGAITERLEHDLIVELTQPDVGVEILDVGCGDGALAAKFAASGVKITGIDPNPDMVETAMRRGCGRFLVADGVLLPFSDDAFDLVVAMTVLCVSSEPEHLVAEMARVLRPGGRVVIGELGRWSLWALSRRIRALFGNRLWRQSRFFNKVELTALLSNAGLQTQAFRGAVYYPPIGMAARLLAWADPMLSQALGGLGAAFIALSAKKADLGRSNPLCP